MVICLFFGSNIGGDIDFYKFIIFGGRLFNEVNIVDKIFFIFLVG